MNLNYLILNNFRNYSEKKIEFNPKLNIITGMNAQGKSNLLEAISYLSTINSFRGAVDGDLIQWGQKFFYIEGFVTKKTGDYIISLGYSQNKKKIGQINGSQRKKVNEIIGTLNSVVFSPDDLNVVKSGPEARRKYLNGEMIQLFPTYYHTLNQYQKILNQKNNLLKEIRERQIQPEMLEIWDDQLVETGSKIIKKRSEVIQKLTPLARLMHRKITQGEENLEINYESLDIKEKIINLSHEEIKKIFFAQIAKRRKDEINRGITLIGPHRDDLELLINNIDVRKFGSQGQQRTTALSLKISELELIKSEIGEYPILLLDDVMSELDDRRRSHLIDIVDNKIQTFITTTDVNFSLRDGLRINIKNGELANI